MPIREAYQQEIEGFTNIIDRLHSLHRYLDEKSKTNIIKQSEFYEIQAYRLGDLMRHLSSSLTKRAKHMDDIAILKPVRKIILDLVDRINKPISIESAMAA